jgi:uncharacterized protein YpuA (DUF1002 family)
MNSSVWQLIVWYSCDGLVSAWIKHCAVGMARALANLGVIDFEIHVTAPVYVQGT